MQEARTDENGRAYAGSQRQIQTYVNKCPYMLNTEIIAALKDKDYIEQRYELGGSGIIFDWVSPMESQQYAEYQDEEFWRALWMEDRHGGTSTFWPKGGPVWDALAIVRFGDRPDQNGALLVEAKSYPKEMYGGGMQAKDPHSIEIITNSLANTKSWLGVTDDADWTDKFYQSANRLAHLYLLWYIMKIPTWLVNVYFMDDPHSPTTRTQWNEFLPTVKDEMGLTDIEVPNAVSVFLPAF